MLAILNHATPSCRTFLSACALCCMLLLPFAASAATPETVTDKTASHEAPAASEMEDPAERARLSGLMAAKVKAKALFSAKIVPELAAAGVDARLSEVTDGLWLLRFDSKVQQEWLNKLTDTKQPVPPREFLSFVRRVEATAKEIRTHRQQTAQQASPLPRKNDSSLAAIRQVWQHEEQRELDAAKALLFVTMLGEKNSRRNVEHANILWELRDKPKALRLAATLFARDSMPLLAWNEVLEKLRTSPQEAEAEMTALVRRQEAQQRYAFATRREGPYDLIGLPVASILPGTEKTLAKRLSLPLAARAVTRPHRSVAFERFATLFPEQKASAKSEEAAKKPLLLPFLKPGEKLYAVLNDRSARRINTAKIRTFRGTPLDLLAELSPVLVEYTPENAAELERMARTGGVGIRSLYFVATSCAPEKLAEHLASLAVMESARERSLYGSFADTAWPEKIPTEVPAPKTPAPFPQDTPGTELRFVNTADADIFFALAPHADGLGLARLMGPIRAVWWRERPGSDAPWSALRYEPVSELTSSPATLGTDRQLSLNTAVLHNILRTKREHVITFWVERLMPKEAGNDAGATRIARSEKTAYVAKRVRELESKGFISPWDIHGAFSLLQREAANPILTESFRNILNDVLMPSAKRVQAMRETARDYLRMKSRATQKKD